MTFISENGISGSTSLRDDIDRLGRFPSVELRISHVIGKDSSRPQVTLSDFLTYSFKSSMLIPVDSFSFSMVAPDDVSPFRSYFEEGDFAYLFANDQIIATGLIDQVEVDVDPSWGEKLQINGRDLMCQFEDQDAVNMEAEPFYSADASVDDVFNKLKQQTRIQKVRKQQATGRKWLFATEPGDTKLAALQRYMNPLNMISWMDPDGTLVIGRPNMAQGSKHSLVMDKANRSCNVLAMKAVMSAAMVPNVYLPIFASQEGVQKRIAKEQVFRCRFERPSDLLKRGHFLQKVIIVSTPQGGSAQDHEGVVAIDVATQAAGGDLLKASAKAEAARQGIKEQIVQVVMPGHFNDNGEPFKVDTCYDIYFDRAGIFGEKMYCYEVEYSLKPDEGQKTSLMFCRLNTIVSDIFVK